MLYKEPSLHAKPNRSHQQLCLVSVCEVTNKDAEAILKAAKERLETDGVVRLRGLPYSCTEGDLIQFFSGEFL